MFKKSLKLLVTFVTLISLISLTGCSLFSNEPSYNESGAYVPSELDASFPVPAQAAAEEDTTFSNPNIVQAIRYKLENIGGPQGLYPPESYFKEISAWGWEEIEEERMGHVHFFRRGDSVMAFILKEDDFTLQQLTERFLAGGEQDREKDDERANVEVISEAVQGEFIFQLVSAKERYSAGEDVEIRARLTYTGDQAEQTIYHAASPFYFYVSEQSRDISIGYGMDQPLKTTVLEKDEWHTETYRKQGSVDMKNDDAKTFFQQFMDEKGFPPGYYTVEAVADFYTRSGDEEDAEKVEYHLETGIGMAVGGS